MGRSVGNSKVCRVKSFEIQQSTRIDRIVSNPYTLPVKKRTSGTTEAEEEAAAPRERKRGANGDLESTPVPFRQARDRETRSS